MRGPARARRQPGASCGSCWSRTRPEPTRCCAPLALEPGEHDLLGVLNDNIADGRDVSWIWDADFELLAGRVRRVTCSGSRASELAVRLKYAGIDPQRIHVQPDLALALRESAADRPDASTPLYALPTYTAMLALRELLRARGEAAQRMGALRRLDRGRLARLGVRLLSRRPAPVAGAGRPLGAGLVRGARPRRRGRHRAGRARARAGRPSRDGGGSRCRPAWRSGRARRRD